jgi:hypothetical protein
MKAAPVAQGLKNKTNNRYDRSASSIAEKD